MIRKNIYKTIIALLLMLAALAAGACSKSVLVTFDHNNNTGDTQIIRLKDGGIKPPVIPENEGLYFGGWWTEKEGGRQWLLSGDTVTESITLYARWLSGLIDVSFDINLPEGQTTDFDKIPDFRLAHGAKVPQPAEPRLDGGDYYFLDWSTQPDIYSPWFFNSSTVTENTVLYAFWSKYIIVSFNDGLDGKDDALETNLPDLKLRSGKAITAPKDIKTQNGNYLFAGWFTDKNYNFSFYNSSPAVEDITLYAKWDETATVSFDLNVPENAAVTWKYPVKYAVRKGYTCEYAYYSDSLISLKWLVIDNIVPADSKHNNAVNTWYFDDLEGNKNIFSSELQIDYDITVYADWRQASFYKFDGNYCEVRHAPSADVQNPELNYDGIGRLPRPMTQYSGKYFVGWFYKDSPDQRYFGERTESGTEFISRHFDITSETAFVVGGKADDGYYLTLSPSFSGAELVLPDSVLVRIGLEYERIYAYKIDLNDFPSIKRLVFSANQTNSRLANIDITYPDNENGFNIFSSAEWGGYIIYDYHLYYALSTDRQGGLPGHSSDETFNYSYPYYDSSFQLVKKLRVDDTKARNYLPFSSSSISLSDKMLGELRFLYSYRSNLTMHKTVYVQPSDYNAFLERQEQGVFKYSNIYEITGNS